MLTSALLKVFILLTELVSPTVEGTEFQVCVSITRIENIKFVPKEEKKKVTFESPKWS